MPISSAMIRITLGSLPSLAGGLEQVINNRRAGMQKKYLIGNEFQTDDRTG
jgi:hypothetical protein